MTHYERRLTPTNLVGPMDGGIPLRSEIGHGWPTATDRHRSQAPAVETRGPAREWQGQTLAVRGLRLPMTGSAP
jgi:hypothetical protein